MGGLLGLVLAGLGGLRGRPRFQGNRVSAMRWRLLLYPQDAQTYLYAKHGQRHVF
jgi:hypothetical protein